MLGRTAHGIVWMFRYLERAENTARLLEAGFRMALTRGSTATAVDEWRSVLVTLGLDTAYDERFTETTGAAVCNFILRDRENPGNVLAMVEGARTNARMVRTAITRELWEATNESWMAIDAALKRPVSDATLGDILALIRRQAMLVRGALEGTMLRNEIFNFARIGASLEAADNTARIVDVKYHVLLPSVAWVGGPLDNTQWEMLLRSVAGERVFRWLHAGNLDPRSIAEFLILDGRFPRSLAYSYAKLASNLRGIAGEYGEETNAHALVANQLQRLRSLTIADIFNEGLHEFLSGMIDQTAYISEVLARDYRFLA